MLRCWLHAADPYGAGHARTHAAVEGSHVHPRPEVAASSRIVGTRPVLFVMAYSYRKSTFRADRGICLGELEPLALPQAFKKQYACRDGYIE